MLIPPDKKNEDESNPSSPGVVRAGDSQSQGYQPPAQSSQGAYPDLQVYAERHDRGAGARAHTPSDLETAGPAHSHSETSPLLPPPPYQPAGVQAHAPHGTPTGGKPRPRTRMRFLAAGCAALVLLILGGSIAALIQHLLSRGGSGDGSAGGGGRHDGGKGGGELEPMPSPDRPVQGGRGGSGKWDDAWTPYYPPLYANETSPRQCDAFSPATLLPDTIFTSQPVLARHTSFRVPISAERVYLHARGGAVRGYVMVTEGEGAADGQVDVRVEVRYAKGRCVMGWHVCRVGDDKVGGVVIVMPRDVEHDSLRYRDVSFIVNIDYPAGHKSARLGALEIHSQNMGLGLAALPYAFTDVDLHTSNGAVAIEDLVADSLGVQSSNGRIDAQQVVVAGTPTLMTTNGAIHCADCCPKRSERVDRWDLHTSNGAISGHYCAREIIDAQTSSGSISGIYDAPAVRAKTSNGRIEGEFLGIAAGGLDLHTSSGSVSAGIEIVKDDKGKHDTQRVPVSVSTSNGAVDVQLLDLPLDTFLDAKVTTTSGSLHFNGHPHFQGDFKLSTSNGALVFDTLKSLPGEPERRTSTVRVPAPGTKLIAGDIKRKGETRAPEKLGSIVAHTSNSELRAML